MRRRRAQWPAKANACRLWPMNFLARIFRKNKVSESRIGRALRNVAESDNSQTRQELYLALRSQRLILQVPKIPEKLQRDESGRLTHDTHIDVVSFKGRDGGKFLALFTNPEALQRWKSGESNWIAVDTPSLCRLALGTDHSTIKINPADPVTVELSRDELRLLSPPL